MKGFRSESERESFLYARVARGAEWLDRHIPGWETLIAWQELKTFDILDQLFTLKDKGGIIADGWAFFKWAYKGEPDEEALGFWTAWPENSPFLEEAWKNLIIARIAVRGTNSPYPGHPTFGLPNAY